jgi:hypothetical protein
LIWEFEKQSREAHLAKLTSNLDATFSKDFFQPVHKVIETF